MFSIGIRKRRTIFGFTVAFAAAMILATSAQVSAMQALAKTTEVSDVIEMVKLGISDDVIIAKLRKERKPFDLSTDSLIEMKKAGVSAGVMKAMLNPQADSQASAVPTSSSAPSLELGVYMKKGGEWVEVQPEVVNWKTGGALKSLATAGVVKKDLNGNVEGPSSKNSVKSPLEVLIVAPEGVAASEYQLLRFRANAEYREFRSVTGGILNQRGGAMRDLVPFESKKVANRNFVLVLPAGLGAGEYGILPPGAGGSSTTNAVSSAYGKMFTFHIVE
jgi:hypothetical protein